MVMLSLKYGYRYKQILKLISFLQLLTAPDVVEKKREEMFKEIDKSLTILDFSFKEVKFAKMMSVFNVLIPSWFSEKRNVVIVKYDYILCYYFAIAMV